MADDQELHDLRGEIGGVRSDIRALRDDVRVAFDRLDGRVRRTEDALAETRVREDERSKLLGAGLVTVRPPLMKDARTYAVGGVGTAIAMIVIEFLKAVAASGAR